MRFEKSRSKNDEERILPLINVVFLLLIFFMLVGKFAAIDLLEVSPPRSASEERVEERELVIELSSGGQLAVDGVLVEQSALQAAVAGKFVGESAPQVLLKADAGTDAVRVIAIMEILHTAGVERLKLLTRPADVSSLG